MWFLPQCGRSGTDEEYAEKKKLLQDIYDLKKDAEEHARVIALAKKTEVDAKKKAADLRLAAMRTSKAGLLVSVSNSWSLNSFGVGGGGGNFFMCYFIQCCPEWKWTTSRM